MSDPFAHVDELSRRHFVSSLSKKLLGVGLAPMLGKSLAAEMPAPPTTRAGAAKSVIFLYMNGGMSHIDSFDPKPKAKEVMGLTKTIPTNVDGIEFGHFIPKLAQCMDKLAIINSMKTTQGAHQQAQYINHASYAMRGTIKHPALASWVSLLGGRRNTTLPASVVINGRSQGLSNGFLSAKYAPLPIQNPEEGLKYSEIPSQVEEDDYHRRLHIAQQMNNSFRAMYNHRDFIAYQELYDEALKVMSSKDLEAFNLDQEEDVLRDAYGRNSFGQGCLLARRLVERKVRFVEVELGGWDTHNNHFERYGDQTEKLDAGLSTLLADLERRGLLDETLVVLTTDFGRTPVINTVREGRDHHPAGFSTLLAGGGIKGGTKFGKTDEQAKKVVEDAVSVQDFNATIAHAMGLPIDRVVFSPSGRPFRIADKGNPVMPLFA